MFGLFPFMFGLFPPQVGLTCMSIFWGKQLRSRCAAAALPLQSDADLALVKRTSEKMRNLLIGPILQVALRHENRFLRRQATLTITELLAPEELEPQRATTLHSSWLGVHGVDAPVSRAWFGEEEEGQRPDGRGGVMSGDKDGFSQRNLSTKENQLLFLTSPALGATVSPTTKFEQNSSHSPPHGGAPPRSRFFPPTFSIHPHSGDLILDLEEQNNSTTATFSNNYIAALCISEPIDEKGKTKTQRVIHRLLANAASEPDRKDRLTLLKSFKNVELYYRNESAAVPIFFQLLEDEVTDTRMVALQTLARLLSLHANQTKNRLKALLRDYLLVYRGEPIISGAAFGGMRQTVVPRPLGRSSLTSATTTLVVAAAHSFSTLIRHLPIRYLDPFVEPMLKDLVVSSCSRGDDPAVLPLCVATASLSRLKPELLAGVAAGPKLLPNVFLSFLEAVVGKMERVGGLLLILWAAPDGKGRGCFM